MLLFCKSGKFQLAAQHYSVINSAQLYSLCSSCCPARLDNDPVSGDSQESSSILASDDDDFFSFETETLVMQAKQQ